MRRRRLQLIASAAALVIASLTGVAAASPASAADVWYYQPGNALSPMFSAGGCQFRIWYGSFGGTPFGKVRMYQGSNCSTLTLGITAQDGRGVYHAVAFGGAFVPGRDSCGTYYELQVSIPGRPGFTLYEWVSFQGTNRMVFAHQYPSLPRRSVVRYC